jgi:CHAT domain
MISEAPVDKLRVLFVASNAVPRDALQIDEEYREIQQRLAAFGVATKLDIYPLWAARIGDLQDALLTRESDVVHFSGHGSASADLFFVGEGGEAVGISPDVLCALFAARPTSVRLVVLNACFGTAHAKAVRDAVGCSIGMWTKISDVGARAFSARLYQSLALGLSVVDAFEQGRIELVTKNRGESATPQLFVREGVDARAWSLLTPGQQAPNVAAPSALRGLSATQILSRMTLLDLREVADALLARFTHRLDTSDAPFIELHGGSARLPLSAKAMANRGATVQSLEHAIRMAEALTTNLQFHERQLLTPFAQLTPYYENEVKRLKQELADQELRLRELVASLVEA